RIEIQTMVIRIIKEVALDAKRLAIHLLPLGTRVDVDLDFSGLQEVGSTGRAWRLWLSKRRGRTYEPVGPHAVQRLLAVGRQLKCSNVIETLVELSFFHIEFLQCRTDGDARRRRRWRGKFNYIQYARLAGSKPENIARRNRQSENALADSVEINAHRLRWLPGARSGTLSRRSVGSLLSALIRWPLAFFLIFLNFPFIAFRGERRRQIFAEHRKINAARWAMRITRHIKAENCRTDISTGGEVKILAALIKSSVCDIAHAVGNLRALVLFERVDERGAIP